MITDPIPMNCWLPVGLTWGAFLHAISVTVALIYCFLSALIHGGLDSTRSTFFILEMQNLDFNPSKIP